MSAQEKAEQEFFGAAYDRPAAPKKEEVNAELKEDDFFGDDMGL